MEVVEPAYIFYMEESEYIVYTGHDFHIGAVGIHLVRAFGKSHERVGGIIGKLVGVVLVCEGAPQGAYADVFAPFQFFDEGQTVEYFSVEVPGEHKAGIAVVEEFHVVDEAEGAVLGDV